MPHTRQPGRPDGVDPRDDEGAGGRADQGAGQGADRPAPGALRALLVGVLLEALVLAAAAVLVAVEAFAGGSGSVAMSVALVVVALGMAWALLAAGRVLRAGRHGGRAVIMTWQIFQGVVAVSMLTAGGGLAVAGGVVLLALAVAVAVLLLTPRVVQATTD
jgi:hypothetical protein